MTKESAYRAVAFAWAAGLLMGVVLVMFIDAGMQPKPDAAVNITRGDFSCTRYPDGKIVISQ